MGTAGQHDATLSLDSQIRVLGVVLLELVGRGLIVGSEVLKFKTPGMRNAYSQSRYAVRHLAIGANPTPDCVRGNQVRRCHRHSLIQDARARRC